jgi:hypothetical protein
MLIKIWDHCKKKRHQGLGCMPTWMDGWMEGNTINQINENINGRI